MVPYLEAGLKETNFDDEKEMAKFNQQGNSSLEEELRNENESEIEVLIE